MALSPHPAPAERGHPRDDRQRPSKWSHETLTTPFSTDRVSASDVPTVRAASAVQAHQGLGVDRRVLGSDENPHH
jgi:hypothetical protein